MLVERKMKLIILTKGKCAQIDDDDYERINQWKWKVDSHGYAVRVYQNKTIFMHREIIHTPEGMCTDHIDHNPLNNCKNNLRICTMRENQGNSILRCDNSSGFKGVCFDKGRKRWIAKIHSGNKRKTIGRYKNPEEAAIAYDKTAENVFGKFALKNFP